MNECVWLSPTLGQAWGQTGEDLASESSQSGCLFRNPEPAAAGSQKRRWGLGQEGHDSGSLP